jgi:hypothetical protein
VRIGHEPVAMKAGKLALGGAAVLLTVLLVAFGTRLLFHGEAGGEPVPPPDLQVAPSLSAAREGP